MLHLLLRLGGLFRQAIFLVKLLGLFLGNLLQLLLLGLGFVLHLLLLRHCFFLYGHTFVHRLFGLRVAMRRLFRALDGVVGGRLGGLLFRLLHHDCSGACGSALWAAGPLALHFMKCSLEHAHSSVRCPVHYLVVAVQHRHCRHATATG